MLPRNSATQRNTVQRHLIDCNGDEVPEEPFISNFFYHLVFFSLRFRPDDITISSIRTITPHQKEITQSWIFNCFYVDDDMR